MMKRQYLLLALLTMLFAGKVDAQRPKYLVFKDEMVMKYFSGGFSKDSILSLYAIEGYDELTVGDKQEMLNRFVAKFPNHQIKVQVNETKKELWLPKDKSCFLVDTWEMKEQQGEKSSPVTAQRLLRTTRRYYYFGGQFSGSKGAHIGTVNGRFGTFLYKDRWDISLALNLGYVKNDAFQFAGSVGLDTRTYFPIQKVRLAPYVGGGVSRTFAPTKYGEIRGLIGTCWFIGGGSIDMGFQYGLNSKLSFTAGYTFSPTFKKRNQ